MDAYIDNPSKIFTCKQVDNIFSEVLRELVPRISYSVPSYILYVIVLIAIKINRQLFSITFVHLFTMCCVYNMASWPFDLFFTTILALSPFCNQMTHINDTYIVSVPYFFYNFFPLANFGCGIAIALHQFTAVFNPLNVEKIWSNKRWVITILTIIIPFFACLHILFGKMIIIPMPNGIIYMKVDHYFSEINFIRSPAINAICGAMAFLIIGTFTSLSIFKICFIKRQDGHRIHKRVFLVACWMSTASLVYGIYQIFISYARFISQNDYEINGIVKFRATVCDVCFLPLPWVVIIVNQKIRTSILSGLKKQKNSASVSVVKNAYVQKTSR